MKKLIIMAALTVAALGSNEANAQKVIKDAAGAVYIDVQDMPAGTFSNSSLNVIRTVDHTENSVFKKLQIAKADTGPSTWAEACGINTSYNSSSAIGQAQGSVNTGCKAYNEGGVTGWRVPTERELMLMWIMKDALVQAGASAFASNYYRASTENNAGTSWYSDFADGSISSNLTKASTTRTARCVREVN